MEILAPILSKCPIVIANLTPNECFSHAGHIIYHEGQQFIYPLLHVFVRFLGSGFVYIEDQPDPVPKPLFWVHQAVERLCPLVEVFVALHDFMKKRRIFSNSLVGCKKCENPRFAPFCTSCSCMFTKMLLSTTLNG